MGRGEGPRRRGQTDTRTHRHTGTQTRHTHTHMRMHTHTQVLKSVYAQLSGWPRVRLCPSFGSSRRCPACVPVSHGPEGHQSREGIWAPPPLRFCKGGRRPRESGDPKSPWVGARACMLEFNSDPWAAALPAWTLGAWAMPAGLTSLSTQHLGVVGVGRVRRRAQGQGEGHRQRVEPPHHQSRIRPVPGTRRRQVGRFGKALGMGRVPLAVRVRGLFPGTVWFSTQPGAQ